MKHRENRSPFLAILKLVFITNRLKIHSFTILLLTSVLSFSALATEVNGGDTDNDLLTSCNTLKTPIDHPKTLPCITYIEGFLNGLLNAGDENVSRIDKKLKKPSTYAERAYANRVGEITQRKPLSHSCVTIDEFKALILKTVSEDTTQTFLSVEQLNSFLLKTLTTACSTDSKSD